MKQRKKKFTRIFFTAFLICSVITFLILSGSIYFSTASSIGTLKISNQGKSWQIIKHDGEQADDFKVDIKDKGNERAEICFYPKSPTLSLSPTPTSLNFETRDSENKETQHLSSEMTTNSDKGQVTSYCYTLDGKREEFAKFGTQSSIIIYQDIQTISYSGEDYSMNLTLFKNVSGLYDNSVSGLFISAQDNSYKFGANDTFVQEGKYNKYQYQISSTTELYSMLPFIVYFYSGGGMHEINFEDICTDYRAICDFQVSGNNANITFKSDKYIDPTITFLQIGQQDNIKSNVVGLLNHTWLNISKSGIYQNLEAYLPMDWGEGWSPNFFSYDYVNVSLVRRLTCTPYKADTDLNAVYGKSLELVKNSSTTEYCAGGFNVDMFAPNQSYATTFWINPETITPNMDIFNKPYVFTGTQFDIWGRLGSPFVVWLNQSKHVYFRYGNSTYQDACGEYPADIWTCSGLDPETCETYASSGCVLGAGECYQFNYLFCPELNETSCNAQGSGCYWDAGEIACLPYEDPLGECQYFTPLGQGTCETYSSACYWVSLCEDTGSPMCNEFDGNSSGCTGTGQCTYFAQEPTPEYCYSNKTLDTNVWTMISITWNETNSTFKMFFNDEIVAECPSSKSGKTLANGWGVGRPISTQLQYINASLDDWMFFNTTLSYSEIQGIFNNNSARFLTSGTISFNNQSKLGISTGYNKVDVRANVTNVLGSLINISLDYYDNSWHTTKAQFFDGNNTFNISVATSNLTINFTLLSGENSFYSPLLFGLLNLDYYDDLLPEISTNLINDQEFADADSNFPLDIIYNITEINQDTAYYNVSNSSGFSLAANISANFSGIISVNLTAYDTYWINITANDTSNNKVSELIYFSLARSASNYGDVSLIEDNKSIEDEAEDASAELTAQEIGQKVAEIAQDYWWALLILFIAVGGIATRKKKIYLAESKKRKVRR